MRKSAHAMPLSAVPLMLLGGTAQSQTPGNITFTANQVSATGSLVPVLTWSTSPVATSCVAGGGWSGTRFASGSETLPRITVSTSYSLTCTWGNGAATIQWTAPTANVDGSPLRDLAGFNVLYGTSNNALTQSRLVNDPGARNVTIAALPSGTWHFTVRAFNQAQLESSDSNLAQKTITGASGSRNLSITINAAPAPTPSPPPPPPPPGPVLVTVNSIVWDLRERRGGIELGRPVGMVNLGVPCLNGVRVASDYYPVDPRHVSMFSNPRSDLIVAQCAPD